MNKLWWIAMIMVILLLVVFIYNKPKQFYQYLGYKNRPDYRLGDMFMMSERDRYFNIGGKTYHLKNYPNSIISEYMRRTQDPSNYDILYQIIKERTTLENKPSKYDLVVHLRLGDVIDNTNDEVDDLLHSQKKYITLYKKEYVRPSSYYKKIFKQIRGCPISKVVLVGGFANSKNCKYVKKIEKMFQDEGYEVNLRIGESPDKDFIYMCNSHHFVKSGGNFSNIICKIVKMNGGKCFER